MKKLTILTLALLMCCLTLFVSCDEKDKAPQETAPQSTEAPDPCAGGHTEAIDAAVAPTCTEKGKTEGKHCSVCNEVLVAQNDVDALGHTEAIDAAVAPTCTEKGKTEGKHCSVCNEVLVAQNDVDALGHTYGEWTVTTPATCTAKGEQAQTCSVCKDVKKQEIAAKGHTWGAWAETLAPTCTAKGSEHRECSVCEHPEIREIKANGHNYVPVVTPPTVKDQGYTTHTCSACSDSFKDSFVPATGSLGLAYTVNADGKTCTITGMGTCTDTEVYINEKIDGYTVTAIGEKAFAEKESIIFICIPNTVKTIGTRAFYKCSALPEITIPESVIDIGTQIFYGCDSLTTVYYNSAYGSKDNQFLTIKSLETVEFGGISIPSCIFYNNATLKHAIIKDSVKNIGDYAFFGCVNLGNVTIGNSVQSIGSYAFQNCNSFTSVIIPNNVTTIGDDAFDGCTNLVSVTIGTGVKSIYGGTFGDCDSLTTIIVDKDNSVYHSKGNCIIETKAKKLITGCNNSIIPTDGSVTSIGGMAFSCCRSLTSITIPDSVTSIGYAAFASCSSLTSIIIPDSVTSIDSNAFFKCSSLTSITIPDSVTSIGEWTFNDCWSLTSITIPDSVTSIGLGAFHCCWDLITVYYTGTPGMWTSLIGSFSSSDYITQATCYYYSETEPTTFGAYWHYVDGIPTVWNMIKYVSNGDGTCYVATAYLGGEFTFPATSPNGDQVTMICTVNGSELTSVTIPNGIVTIDNYAFDLCINLTSVVIPNSVTTIEDDAFRLAYDLTTCYYIGTKNEWNRIAIGRWGNDKLTNATRYYYSETEPTDTANNYWHYVDSVPTAW